MPGRFGTESTLYRKRGIHPGRAIAPVVVPSVAALVPSNVIPTPQAATKDTKTPATVTTSATTAATTATADDDPIPGFVSSVLSSVLGDSTSSTSSSSTSTPSASPTASRVTTSSLPKLSSVPPITSATSLVVVHTKSVASTQSQTTPSEAAQSSGGISAATVIGGIGGALAATLFLTVLIAFFLRRWRRKRSAEDAFDASQFRRSAAPLDEKDDSTLSRPRPPTMIERKNTSPPSAAYPSNEPHVESFQQHGANQVQYRAVSPQHPSFAAGNQFGGNGGAPPMHYGAHPYAMDFGQGDSLAGPGQGAPPIPGIHGPGAYAPYGLDPRYPRSQRSLLSQQSQNQVPQQQLYRGTSVSSLPNPFSVRTEGSIHESLPSPTLSSRPVSSNPPATSFVTRQAHEAPPAYSNNGEYLNVQRDVKMSPLSLNVMNQGSDAAAAAAASSDTDATTTQAVGITTMTESNEKPRPRTVYDDDDVYGGM